MFSIARMIWIIVMRHLGVVVWYLVVAAQVISTFKVTKVEAAENELSRTALLLKCILNARQIWTAHVCPHFSTVLALKGIPEDPEELVKGQILWN